MVNFYPVLPLILPLPAQMAEKYFTYLTKNMMLNLCLKVSLISVIKFFSDSDVSIMVLEDSCQNCGHKDKCAQVYEKLGNTAGPSVVLSVVISLLLPLVVFIAALLFFERIFVSAIQIEKLRIAVTFLVAALTAFLFAIVLKRLFSRFFNR